MKSKNRSAVWYYFDKLSDTKALCRLCYEEYSFQGTTGNLKCHLKKKHNKAFLQLVEAQEQSKQAQAVKGTTNDKEEVILFVAENPNSPATSEQTEKVIPDMSDMLQSRNLKDSFLKRNREISQEAVDFQQKRLITQFTKGKIAVASVQKELIEKELEEKTIKVLLLQEEIEHRRHMHELEKQEINHKKEMQKLAQEEMQLKIELLKSELPSKITRPETIIPTTDK